MTIAVLGAGNWGTTAALLLHGNGHDVRLWEFFEERAREMIETRENARFLPGVTIPPGVTVTSSLEQALDGAEIVVFVVPSSVMRDTARSAARSGRLSGDAVLVSLSKGLEHDSLATMTDIIAEETGGGHPLAAMSGPCIANEIARGLPTTIVAASDNSGVSCLMQEVFMTPRFRVYTSGDPLGVQLGGAVKNIVAVAAGMNDGMGFGANAKSALATRGIVEMRRFGESMGANPETFNGLSGIGDLITTCFSAHSRNRRVGEEVAGGRALDEVLRDMVMVAEGVPTTSTVHDYAAAHGIDMPITAQVHRVLFEGVPPGEAVDGLMGRDGKPEIG